MAIRRLRGRISVLCYSPRPIWMTCSRTTSGGQSQMNTLSVRYPMTSQSSSPTIGIMSSSRAGGVSMSSAPIHGTIFANLGTDHVSLIEEIARFDRDGRRHPQIILCPHEVVAVHMAGGYALATGRGQAVFVHVDAGTANEIGRAHV